MRSYIYALLALLFIACLTGCPPPKKTTDVATTNGHTNGGSSLPTEYRFPLPDDAISLDPAHITDTVSDSVARRIFNTLLTFDADCNVVEDLAEWYAVSDDGLEYKFKLREDVQFHNGEPLTADDVAYSCTRLLDPATNSERANLLFKLKGARQFHAGESTELEGIKVIDEYTVKFILDEPYTPFPKVLCMTNFGVVPRTAVERDPSGFGNAPVGSGPFVFQEWKRKEKIVLKSNRVYFGEVPKIQTLVFRVLTDESTRFENFRTGALEHCDLLPSQIELVNKDPELKGLVTGKPAMDMYCYGFNCEKPPFKDNTALRQALNYAVDKQNIVKNIYGGLVTEQKTYVPAGMFYEWEDAPGYPYDVEKAKELMVQAGYPNGEGLPELVLNISQQATHKQIAQAVMYDLEQIGVKVRIEVLDWGSFLEKVYAGEALLFQNTWLGDYPDPDTWLYQLLHSENFGEAGNITRWSNSEFDHYVTSAARELDEAVRISYYSKAEKIALDEAPWLLLFWKNNSTLVQPYVKNLKLTQMDRSPQLNHATVEDVYYEYEGE